MDQREHPVDTLVDTLIDLGLPEAAIDYTTVEEARAFCDEPYTPVEL